MYEFEEAERQSRSAINDLLEIQRDFPRFRWAQRELASCYMSLADSLAGQDRFVDAETAVQEALRVAQAYHQERRLYDDDPYFRLIANAHVRMGLLRWWQKDRQAARKAFADAQQRFLSTLQQSEQPHDGTRKDFARFLATCPDADFHDPQQVMSLTEEMILFEDGRYWMLMGIANYQAGNWQAAIDALEESRRRMSGGDAFHWVFLAMAHAQLGDPRAARSCYSQAVAAVENRHPMSLLVFLHPRQLNEYLHTVEPLLTLGGGDSP
jgi:tetratricopeptide (TPR) repeat protein